MEPRVFTHSVKLPSQYKNIIKIVKKVIVEKHSCNDLLRNARHTHLRKASALIDKLFKNKDLIDKVIEKSLILQECDRLDYYACLVLVTELLLGSQKLSGQSKPVLTVLNYENILKACFQEEVQNISIQEKVILPRYVRVNTLKTTLSEAHEICTNNGYWLNTTIFSSYPEYLERVRNIELNEYLVDFHIETLFVFHHSSSRHWVNHSVFLEHKFILQDKASMFPTMLLNLKKNKTVLDFCAAPGMKTTHIAAVLKNKGKVYAVELNKERYKSMCEILEMNGAKCVKTILNDALYITEKEAPNVDCILVDPSCSGSGMMRRMGMDTYDPARLSKLAGFQITILSHAMEKFPTAKRIVYSTCSINEEENEAVIEKCLQRCKNYRIIDPRPILKNSWLHFGNEEKYKDIGKNSFYTVATDDLCNGFFVAAFDRIDSTDDTEADIDEKIVQGGIQIEEEFKEGEVKKKRTKTEHIDLEKNKKDFENEIKAKKRKFR